MKFEKATPAFIPRVITLESQEEEWDLLALLSRTSKGEAYTDIYYQLYRALGGSAEHLRSGLRTEGGVTVVRKFKEES